MYTPKYTLEILIEPQRQLTIYKGVKYEKNYKNYFPKFINGNVNFLMERWQRYIKRNIYSISTYVYYTRDNKFRFKKRIIS